MLGVGLERSWTIAFAVFERLAVVIATAFEG